MTVFTQPDSSKLIKWDPGDPIDWTTPNVSDGISREYCGNCGLDYPGCGCPRDCARCLESRAYCGHLEGGYPGGTEDELDDEYCEHDCGESGCFDDGFEFCHHEHCPNCGGCTCPGYCDDYQTYNLRPSETGGDP